MDASKNDKAKKQSKEKTKLRRWILQAVEDVEGNKGATVQDIQKFLDSKKDGISSRPEWKRILKKLLNIGHLMKNDGRYIISKWRMTSGKVTKNSAAHKANKEARRIRILQLIRKYRHNHA
ncbi:hypothetical protein AVEN_26787-1 [Araneus ventricosus]|uniref:H15 domain-containing protein n=1 Tax=Araneus ventricosus TaxID=182803 RepID=A0A4Y2D582_ARAVE|nr:hypothetical protein AVEN_26787-1 [Araneus ventricosus]